MKNILPRFVRKSSERGVMKEIKTTCDNCNKDLKDIRHSYGFCLSSIFVHKSYTKANGLERDYHFCSLKCLKAWIK